MDTKLDLKVLIIPILLIILTSGVSGDNFSSTSPKFQTQNVEESKNQTSEPIVVKRNKRSIYSVCQKSVIYAWKFLKSIWKALKWMFTNKWSLILCAVLLLISIITCNCCGKCKKNDNQRQAFEMNNV